MKDKTNKVTKIIVIVLSILVLLGLAIFGIYKYVEYRHIRDNINSIYDIYNNDDRNDIITDFINENSQKIAGTPVTIEYPLAEEEIEAYIEEQQEAHNQLQNAKTYKTVTNVFTENAEVEMEYIADTKTYVDNEINSIKEQLNTVNELLSTTKTSAMLLDNMQSDLESEVL